MQIKEPKWFRVLWLELCKLNTHILRPLLVYFCIYCHIFSIYVPMVVPVSKPYSNHYIKTMHTFWETQSNWADSVYSVWWCAHFRNNVFALLWQFGSTKKVHWKFACDWVCRYEDERNICVWELVRDVGAGSATKQRSCSAHEQGTAKTSWRVLWWNTPFSRCERQKSSRILTPVRCHDI